MNIPALNKDLLDAIMENCEATPQEMLEWCDMIIDEMMRTHMKPCNVELLNGHIILSTGYVEFWTNMSTSNSWPCWDWIRTMWDGHYPELRKQFTEMYKQELHNGTD